MFASSSLVPQAYQGKPMDCTIAVDMANRMGVSPMMVMQNLLFVQGKPQWSGQACTSMIMASEKYKNVHHVYTGERGTDSWGCYLEADKVDTGETVKGAEVTIQMAKDEGWYGKNGSKWKTMPELMLAYRASAFFARVHIPNSPMGCAVMKSRIFQSPLWLRRIRLQINRRRSKKKHPEAVDNVRDNGATARSKPGISFCQPVQRFYGDVWESRM